MYSAGGMRKGRRRVRAARVRFYAQASALFFSLSLSFSPSVCAGLNIEREGTGSFSTRMPPVAPSDRPTITRRLAPEKKKEKENISFDLYKSTWIIIAPAAGRFVVIARVNTRNTFRREHTK